MDCTPVCLPSGDGGKSTAIPMTMEDKPIEPKTSMIQESPAPESAKFGAFGTVLEAAFVDPAYTWPPPEGEGKNAIELQASVSLMANADGDDGSIATTESQKRRMRIPPKPKSNSSGGGLFGCCKSDNAVVVHDWELARKEAIAARKEHYSAKKARSKEYRKKNRYSNVPEGILIYRLDTSNQTLTLMSQPNRETKTKEIVQEIIIATASPSLDKSRRGIIVTSTEGKTYTLVATEQRTAISWLEAMDLMLANKSRLGDNVRVFAVCVFAVVVPFSGVVVDIFRHLQRSDFSHYFHSRR